MVEKSRSWQKLQLPTPCSSKCTLTIRQYKANHNQICWLVKKHRRPSATSDEYKTFQEFLDQQQYTVNGVLRYEKIFGENFVSTGGKDTTVEFVDQLGLKPGQKVLYVGSGLGGSAFYMAEVCWKVTRSFSSSFHVFYNHIIHDDFFNITYV